MMRGGEQAYWQGGCEGGDGDRPGSGTQASNTPTARPVLGPPGWCSRVPALGGRVATTPLGLFPGKGRTQGTRTGRRPGLPALTPGALPWLQTWGLARSAAPVTLGRGLSKLLWGLARAQAAAGHEWVSLRIRDTQHHLLFPTEVPYSQPHTLVSRTSQVPEASG